jgi:hypothetical protein
MSWRLGLEPWVFTYIMRRTGWERGFALRWSCILHFQPYTPCRLFSMDQERWVWQIGLELSRCIQRHSASNVQ